MPTSTRTRHPQNRTIWVICHNRQICVGAGFYPSRRYNAANWDAPMRNGICCVLAVRCAILLVRPAREGENPSPTACRGMLRFLRYVTANLLLPNGRTEASAPTRRCAFSPMVCAILRSRTAGSMWASTPTDIFRIRHPLCKFVRASCTGGATPSPTLRRNNTSYLSLAPPPAAVL